MMQSNDLIRVDHHPPYFLKRSKRAKSVKLVICRQRGIIVTIPYRFKINDLQEVLLPYQSWMEQQHQFLQTLIVQSVPKSILFPAIGETWRVSCIESQHRMQTFIRPDRELVLFGKTDQLDVCLKTLSQWVKDYAGARLEKLLHEWSDLLALPIKDVVIRCQKTIWGSCTINKVISLNAKLIFLPEPLARYVLIHELCHTKHMNHSSSFWNLVESFDPDWREHRRQLKKADCYIPGWV